MEKTGNLQDRWLEKDKHSTFNTDFASKFDF